MTHFTKAQKQFFDDKGYLLGPAVLSSDQVETLKRRMDGIFDGSIEFPDMLRGVASADVEGNPQLNKIANLFRHERAFGEVIGNSAISSLALDLMEGPVRVWEDQAIAKAPRDQHGVVAWHRDYTYWDHVGPPQLATCWIALDDATVENGCMQVIPGSHKWKLDFHRDEVDNDDPDWVLKRPEVEANAASKAEHCLMKAGHCHFHHCLTLHGSFANTTNHPRRSYILHLMPGNTRRVGDSWNLRMARVEDVPVGEVVQGASYPELAPVG